MKRKMFVVLAIVAVMSWSALAMADTINTGGATFAAIPALDNAPPPFWDNVSLDPPGTGQNVGFKLTAGLGGFPTVGGEYLSNGGLVANNVTFNGGGGGQTETLLLEISAHDTTNALWAYNVADPTQRISLFTGGDAATLTKTVAITFPTYGFLLIDGTTGNTFFSGAGAVSKDGDSNFAFFRDPALGGTWWFGVEDLPSPITTEGIGDYNDMIVKVSTVPIPPSVLLMGSGLLGLVGFRRFRKS